MPNVAELVHDSAIPSNGTADAKRNYPEVVKRWYTIDYPFYTMRNTVMARMS